ncbi:hypothetical protein EDD22DRAFT_964196 [Suillus occidentalis]|nr:hypothetical protein EDD22DRAFT_964196 [Suillus occidentalis]
MLVSTPPASSLAVAQVFDLPELQWTLKNRNGFIAVPGSLLSQAHLGTDTVISGYAFWMLALSLALISDYVLLVPLAYTIGIRYGIANKAIIEACFLPNGLGNFNVVLRKWQTSLSDTIMTSADSSIHTNIAALFGVEGQVAVVTGGGTGTGLMITTVLESNGATVYIIGRRLEVIEKAAKENNGILHS